MKKGFTLIEMIAVIAIIASISVVVFINVEKNISDVNKFGTDAQKDTIESSAIIYMNEYLNSNNEIELITLSDLINSGILPGESVSDLNSNNKVLIVSSLSEVKYLGTTTFDKPVIFITGDKEISIRVGSTYTDSGAKVVLPNCSNNCIENLAQSNISSTVNTNTVGKYKVTYSYPNAKNVSKTVYVIE